MPVSAPTPLMKPNLPILAALLSFVAIALGQNPAAPDASAPAAQTAIQKWLADLDAQWQAVFKREVSDPYDAENDRLRSQYVAALEAGVSKASGAGDLNAAIAWRNEQKRFAEASALPAQDDAADPLPVKQLRAAWRSQLPRMEKDRATRAKALHARYDPVLAQTQAQLTKANRLDDAVLVKSQRDKVAAAWLAGIAAAPSAIVVELPKPPAKIPLKPPAGRTTAKMDDRALADKLTEMGCLVRTSESVDGMFTVTNLTFGKKDWTGEDFAVFDQLGKLPWLAIEANSATDALIERVRACRKLSFLTLYELPNVTGKGVQIVTDLPELKYASIVRLSIGDASFKSAFEKSNVEILRLTDIGITDASLATMGGMRSLRQVSLSTLPGLTAAGWLGLSKARQLRSLELEKVHPGPDGFAHLAKCQSLDSLEFRYALPTDEELQVIRTMKHLRTFKVSGAIFSDDFIASLKAALPNLIIHVNGTPR
jgi:hypothetical protein